MLVGGIVTWDRKAQVTDCGQGCNAAGYKEETKSIHWKQQTFPIIHHLRLCTPLSATVVGNCKAASAYLWLWTADKAKDPKTQTSSARFEWQSWEREWEVMQDL